MFEFSIRGKCPPGNGSESRIDSSALCSSRRASTRVSCSQLWVARSIASAASFGTLNPASLENFSRGSIVLGDLPLVFLLNVLLH